MAENRPPAEKQINSSFNPLVRAEGEGETIAAIGTPPGAGALGLLRLSGPTALDAVLSFLRPAQRISAKSEDASLNLKDSSETSPELILAPRVATLVRAHFDTPIDQVVATYYPAPNSATGEDVVEISAHGSPYILKRLLEAAVAGGARLAEPGEFTQRAYLNGKLDLAQAEAVADLIQATSESAHRAALYQLEGGLSKEVRRLRESVLDFLAQVEANLDHPDENIPAFDGLDAAAALAALEKPILSLAGTFEEGRLLREGARLCIVGRPNAGKSSLLNALLGAERAIVCDEPGTTRDTIEEPIQIAGLSAVLIDTAGMRKRESAGIVETLGIERSGKALQSCDMALLVVDGSRTQNEDDARVHQSVVNQLARNGRPLLTVLNKADLPRQAEVAADVAVSALTREGLEPLKAMIAEKLLSDRAGQTGVVVTSLRHHKALLDAAAEIGHARTSIGETGRAWEDLAASHLCEAARFLGEIIGEGTPDEVLTRIFSRFCVGK